VPSPPSKVMKPTIGLDQQSCLRVPLYHANAAGEMAGGEIEPGLVLAFA
jgi:hypothetical protein